MSNPYYNASGWPATGSTGRSAPGRAELALIAAGFALLPTLSGNGSKAVVVNAGGTALGVTTGTLTLAGNFATSGAFGLTFVLTAGTSVTLPTTGTLATLAGAESLSNKTLVAPILGTPASGTLTNCTGLPISSGVSGLAAGVATFLATPSSANLITAMTDETGSGALVFGTAPTITGATIAGATITTPTITGATITAPTITGGAITALTSLGIRSTGSGAFDLTIANTENLTAGRTLTVTLNDAARTVNLGGNITTAAAFSTSGAFALTLTTTALTNVTLPITGTLATLAGAESLSNKTLTAVASITLVAAGAINWAAGNVALGASIGANTLSVGGASSTVRILGNLQVDGSATVPGASLVLLGSVSTSSGTTADFTSNLNSTYDYYIFKVVGVRTTGGNLRLQVSVDGGSNWKTDATYVYTQNALSSAATNTPAGSSSGTSLLLTGSTGGTTVPGLTGDVELSRPSDGASPKMAKWSLSFTTGDTNTTLATGAGFYPTDVSAITAIRFLTSGTFSSGTIYLYGVKKS